MINKLLFNTRFFLTIFSIVFFALSSNAQPGCPDIDAGPDVNLNCTTPCTTLNATVLQTGLTTSYSASSIPYAPPYSYSAGTPLSVNTDDVWSGVLNIPFTFCFFGTAYTQLVAGSNGCISFNTVNANAYCAWSYTVSCPDPNIINGSTGPYILGPFHDIDPAVVTGISGSGMYYNTYGSYPCRTFVVSWNEVAMFSCTTIRATHMIVMYESTNTVEVYIQNKPLCSTWNSGNATVGVQDATGTIGTAAPGRNTSQWTASNEAWRFTPNGTPNYVVTWFDGGTAIGTGLSTTVCPAVPTTYTAQVVYTNCDATQVVVTDDVVVSPGNSIGLNITPLNPAICQGDNVTLTASSADPSASYSWSTGSSSTSINVAPSTTTSYTVTATTASCTSTLVATVTVESTPTISISPPSPSVCSGTPVSLTASGAVNYTWSPASGLSSTTGATVTASPTSTTTYTVTGSTAGGCSNTTTVTVNVSPIPTSTFTSTASVCVGSNVTVTYTGSATPAANYTWNFGGGTVVSGSGQGPYQISWSSSGPYNITLTVDENGCTSTQTITSVTVYQLPTSTFTASTPICMAGNCTVAYTGNASAGATYTWNFNGATIVSGSGQGPYVVNWGTPGAHNVTLTVTENGCSSTVTIIPVQISNLSATANVINNIACFGQANGSASATPTGGYGTYTYSWAPSGGSASTASGLGPGIYTVTIADSLTCQTTATVTITEPPLLTVNLVSVTNELCYGGTNGSISINANGGTSGYTYTWAPSGSGTIANNLPANTYTVTVTDANSCTSTISQIVTQPPALTSLLTPADEHCVNSCDGSVQTNAGGGTGTLTYSWSNGAATQDISSLCPGSYSVTITDANNCQLTDNASIGTATHITANFNSDGVWGVVPYTVAFTYTGSGATTYQWNFGDGSPVDNSSNPSHTYTVLGVYDVMLIVNSGSPDFCSDTFHIQITVEGQSKLTMPNVFTPNQDGYNDTFKPDAENLATLEVSIFDRWGKLIGEFNTIDGFWDGKNMHSKKEASDGVYYYILSATGRDKVVYNLQGTVTLIKGKN
jgi:gliding motility-associated-like protein